ncbi:MAG: hypothetical protein OXF44_11185 [Anaerolineaceae bacterium]|nr:hypothetical protein [Anaerolineaceae bacterium]
MNRTVLLLTTLFLLCAAALAQARPQIEGLADADLALLTGAGMDGDSLHFDLVFGISVTGDPALAMGIDLAGPGAIGMDAAGLPLMTIDLEGSSSAVAWHEERPGFLELRLVDNVLYEFINKDEDLGWLQISLEKVLADAGLPVHLGEVAGARALDFLAWLEFLGLDGFSSGARSDVDGMATFRIDVDLDAWLESPSFRALMTLAADVTQDVFWTHVGNAPGLLLRHQRLSIETVIELDSGLMRRLALDLELGVNPLVLGGDRDETSEINLTLAFDNMRYGGDVEVSVPADAFLADA